MYQIASNANNKISIPPTTVGARTYAMDGDVQYIHTTCMHAWFHVAKLAQCSSLKGRVDDANDKNTIAPPRTIEHQPPTSTKKRPERAHMKRQDHHWLSYSSS